MIAHEGHVHEALRQAAGAHSLIVNHLYDIGSCAEKVDEAQLHVVEAELLVLNGLVVEINAEAADGVDDVLRGTQLLGDIGLGLFLKVLIEPFTTVELVVLHVLPVVGTAVVGREEEQIVAASHLGVEGLEQALDVLVEPHIGAIGMLAARAPFMADDIGLGIADAEHVGGAAVAQILALQGRDGHIGDEVATEGIESHVLAHLLEFLVLGHLGVNVLGIGGQFVHIVGAGDEAALGDVHPIGCVGATASRQDGSTVFIADANDLGTEVGVEAQLVADGRGQQQMGRRLAFLAVGAHGAHGGVLDATHRLAIDIERVAADAVIGWGSAGIDGAVANGGDGGHIVDEAVVHRIALGDQALQSAVIKLVVIAREVVPAHLVDHHANHQLGSLCKNCLGHRGETHGQSKNEKDVFLHILVVEFFQFFCPVLAQVGPLIIIWCVGGLDWQGHLALVEQGLHQDVALSLGGLVEDELDVATHGEDLVVLPVLVEFVKVLDADVAVAQFHEAGQRHHAYLVAKAHGGLRLAQGYAGVGRLDDIGQEVILTEGHVVVGHGRAGIAQIPAHVVDAPLVVAFLGGEEVDELKGRVVVALHVDHHLEELAHQGVAMDAVGSPLLVVEQHLHQALGVGVAVVELVDTAPVHVATALLDLALPVFVEVVLQGLAHVVVDAGGGVGSHQFLALGHHRQNATVDHGAAGIDGHVLAEEYLREMLGNALADAMVLAFTHGGQVAQTLVGGLVELLQETQHTLALLGQFAIAAGLLQGTDHAVVVVLANEPARTVASVVGEIERHVALGGLGVDEVGQLSIIVHIVRACQEGVGVDVFTSGLCRGCQGDSHQEHC